MSRSDSKGKPTKNGRETQAVEEDDLSSSVDSRGSLNSEEYALVKDYVANLDQDEETDLLASFVKRGSKGVEGMDMDDTEAWVQTPNDLPPPPKRKRPKRMKGGKEWPDSAQASPAPATPKSRGSTSRNSTPHSRNSSTQSTPSSRGKKERRGYVRASPVPIQQLRQHYSKSVSFVVAVDPISKLMDDDSLIIVPHAQVTTHAALEAATIDHVVSEIAAAVLSDAALDPTIEPSDLPALLTSEMELSEPISSSDDEDEDEDSLSDSAEGEAGEFEESEEIEDSEENEEFEDNEESEEFDEDMLDEDDLELLEQLEAAGVFDSHSDEDEESSEGDMDVDSEEVSSSESDEEAEDSGRPTVITRAIHTPGQRATNDEKMDVLNLEKDLGISRAGVQMKHDSRRAIQKKHSRADPSEVGEFASSKKVSKADRKKQKKKNRDDVALEYRELETWNELIRDFIEHAPMGAPMPFSPMGRYQRKQLHWLSEFYGLRSQSFGSGTRRMTSVFVTKRTILHDFSFSLAAIKAIHQGNHPFLISTAELEQDAARLEAEAFSPSKRRPREAPASKHSKKKNLAKKTRSPLIKLPRNVDTRSRPTRRSRMDYDDEDSGDEHHGLEGVIKVKSIRVVGAGASHIPESNLGHMMLRRLGWANTGLGKDEQGIAQPIAAFIKSGRGGLGS